jgi:hypothetical protein
MAEEDEGDAIALGIHAIPTVNADEDDEEDEEDLEEDEEDT